MRHISIFAAVVFALTGCATEFPQSPEGRSTPSKFAEQDRTEAHGSFFEQTAPALPIKPIAALPIEPVTALPIRPVAALPIQPVAASGASLAGLIKKAPSTSGALPIVAMPVKSLWTLTIGHTVGEELQAWGEKAGWKVIWTMSKDWSVPASTSFAGDFKSAATDVIKTLALNGALVRAQFYDGNKTMIVTGPGVAPQ